ncbi:LZIC protein [Pycnococcus provasolii]
MADAALKKNVEAQLDRLVAQLSDLEEALRDGDLTDEEYAEERASTLEQLTEFQASLRRMQGDNASSLTLVDPLSAMRLAIQAAIRQAFKAPDVIASFAKRDSEALRGKLETLTAVALPGKGSTQHTRECAEVLTALRQLGGELSDAERAFLDTADASDISSLFDQASNDVQN